MSPDAAFVRPGPDWLPRLMVIDGCNVGRSACGLTREAVSCAGLLSVIRWLLLRDFDCVAFLPVVYNNVHNSNATQVQLLAKLEEVGLVTFTPARAGSGERRAFINYDDLYVTTLAERHGGCVLSGDKFKDILAQPQYSEFHNVIVNRVLDVKFLFLPHEIVHFGDDVFYRAAPELFINKDLSTRAATISKIIHACPDDADFAKVATRRQSFTPFRRHQCLRICDDLLYELSERESLRPMKLHSLPACQPRVPMESGREFTLIPGEDWTLARDDSVWQPSSIVVPFSSDSPRHSEASSDELPDTVSALSRSPSPEHVIDESPLIDFSDDQVLSGGDSAASACIQPPFDPFDLIDNQLRNGPLVPAEVSHWDHATHLPQTYAQLASRAVRNHEADHVTSISPAGAAQLPPVVLPPPGFLAASSPQLEDLLATTLPDRPWHHVANVPPPRSTSRFFPQPTDSVIPDVSPPLVVNNYTSPTVVEVSPSPTPESVVDVDVLNEIATSDSAGNQLAAVTSEPVNDQPTPEDPPLDDRADLVQALSDIFPRDIVQTVMTMNASSNLDFLAEQCLLLSCQ